MLICDEVDRYPSSAGKEGDPVDLAEKRTLTFWNRKVVMISTPTVKGLSRIEKAYEESDKRLFEIPCPLCGFLHALRWSNVVWHDRSPSMGDPAKAMLLCPACGGHFTNAQKNAAVKRGRWRATAPFSGKAGFWINELYSPWTSIGHMAKRFLEVKDDPARLMTFVNTALAETWDDAGESLSEGALLARCENYPAEAPSRVLVITAGVDVQPDRLELEIVGWGAGEESWSLHYRVIHGDPDIAEGRPGSPWTVLTDLLRNPILHEWGFHIAIDVTCIDSGGHNTQAVYDYCKRHKASRIFAVKGRGGDGIPVISSPNRKRTGMVRRPVDVFIVGVDQAKDTIMRRLAIESPGPGYCHFPFGRDAEWFRQLTAEKRLVKHHKGFAKREWVKIDGRRNEALDCRVYAYAALVMYAPQMDRVAHRLRLRRDALPPPEATAAMTPDGKITPIAPETTAVAATDPAPKPAPPGKPRKPRVLYRTSYLWNW